MSGHQRRKFVVAEGELGSPLWQRTQQSSSPAFLGLQYFYVKLAKEKFSSKNIFSNLTY
jgi:hypothetical protein